MPNQRTIIISNNAELVAAISDLQGGDTLLLKSGEYDGFDIIRKEFSDSVVITSLDSDNPATITSDIAIKSSSNIELSNIKLSIDDVPDNYYEYALDVTVSENIKITNLTVDSEIPDEEGVDLADAESATQKIKGYAFGSGIGINNCSNVDITNNEIYNVFNSIRIANSSGVDVYDNEIYQAREGVKIASVIDIDIKNNYFHDFKSITAEVFKMAGNDHSDIVQYLVLEDGRYNYNKNINVESNLVYQGDGNATQSVFGSSGPGDPGITYNITVKDNVIINSHINGIVINDTDGAEVSGNILLPAFPDSDSPVYYKYPLIRPADNNTEYTIHDNIVVTGRFNFLSGIDFYNQTGLVNALGADWVSEAVKAVFDNADDYRALIEQLMNGGTSTVTPDVERVEIYGEAGVSDKIIGSDAAEIIDGQGGKLDLLTGGGGSDVFQFGSLVGNNMRDGVLIFDYQSGEDVIDLGDGVVTSISHGTRGDKPVLRLHLDGERDWIAVDGVEDISEITFLGDSPFS